MMLRRALMAATTTTCALVLSIPTFPAMSATAAADGTETSTATEVAHLNPRVLFSHAGGLTLIDSGSGAVLAEEARPAFLRLNDAGDGRHVMVSDTDQFLVYDTGIEAHAHGDHSHYYASAPRLTEVSYPAPHAGHVVVHGDHTTLYADGTGEMWTFDTDSIAKPGAVPEYFKAPAAHHGVAVKLTDGRTLHTLGTEDERRGVRVITPAGRSVAHTNNCPGVHGEAAAQPWKRQDIVAIGCENGPVIFDGHKFRKVHVRDAYARTGNLKGLDDSPILLGDYKVDAEAAEEGTIERPTRISLIDTRTATLTLVDLGSAYWFRSLARNDRNGDAVVLTYDGRLTIVDEQSGEVTERIKVIAPWREKKDWEKPGPAVKVVDGLAYVTDVTKNRLVIVDLTKKKVVRRLALPHTPVEFAVTTGEHAH